MDVTSIRQARQDAGLSQAELARRVGVSAVAVHRWEKGERQPSSDWLAKVAAVLAAAPQQPLSPRRRAGRKGAVVPASSFVLIRDGAGVLVVPSAAQSVEVVVLDGSGPAPSTQQMAAVRKAAVHHPLVAQFLADAVETLLSEGARD